MRTTLTLEDDVARQLKEAARLRGLTFKEIVDETLRQGLRQVSSGTIPLPRFKVQARPCGFRHGVDTHKLNQLYDELEIEDFNLEVAEGSERQ